MKLFKILTKKLICFLVATLSTSTIIFAGSFTNSTTTNSNFSRAKAYSYMIEYAVNPNSSNYAYFGGIGGDCTNFVSQVLNSGGVSQLGNDGTQYNSNQKAWYYTNSSVRSTSWTGAHEFRKHWANVNDVGYNRDYKYEVYTAKEFLTNFNDIYSKIWRGDVIQHVSSVTGDTTHSMVVSDYLSGTIKVAQHSVGTTSNFLYRDLKTFVENKSSSDFIVVHYIKNGN